MRFRGGGFKEIFSRLYCSLGYHGYKVVDMAGILGPLVSWDLGFRILEHIHGCGSLSLQTLFLYIFLHFSL